MTLDLQFKLKSNPLYLQYLHDHSFWYKRLNRNPNTLNEFIEEMKEQYHLRPTDRLNKIMNTLEMINTLTSAFRK